MGVGVEIKRTSKLDIEESANRKKSEPGSAWKQGVRGLYVLWTRVAGASVEDGEAVGGPERQVPGAVELAL